MTSENKAVELINNMKCFCRSLADAKCASIQVCEEILKTKNFQAVLDHELVDFQNAYWKHVIEYIHRYKE
jgi:tRNA U34 2-thiouridine synthase MnmA/TrmU